MAKTLYLGIDVSMAENTCCPLLQDGTEAKCRFTVPESFGDFIIVGFLNSCFTTREERAITQDTPYLVVNVQSPKLDISLQGSFILIFPSLSLNLQLVYLVLLMMGKLGQTSCP